MMPFAHRDVAVDGVRLRVVDDGPRGARETLVFVHGNPAWSYLWRRFLAAGKEAGHRVVAPDLAGFGLSDKPRDPGYHTLERHVANLGAVAEALDLRDATLVLHDWGGPIGLGWAVRQPERVKRLVLTNTVAFAPKKPRPLSPWHRFMAGPLGQFLALRANLIARSAFRHGVTEPLPREVREAYLAPMRERGGRIAAAALVRLVPDGPLHPTAGALRAVEMGFPRLQGKPVLVLWADRDPVMGPRLAEKWREAFPQAEVRHVAPAGHFWQEDAPGAFLPHVLGFLRERRGAGGPQEPPGPGSGAAPPKQGFLAPGGSSARAAMARAFVLIDVLPNRDKEVLESLGKMPFVVAKRPLKQRVGQADLLVLIEGKDQAELETFITSRMRMSWVHSVKRVMPHHTMLGWVQREMEDMVREVESRGGPRPPP